MEAKTLRSRARANLAGNWGVSIAVAVVAVLLGGLITGVSFFPEMKYDFPLDRFPALAQYVEGRNRGLCLVASSWISMTKRSFLVV